MLRLLAETGESEYRALLVSASLLSALAALEQEDGDTCAAAVLGARDRVEAGSPRFAAVAGRWFPPPQESSLPAGLRDLVANQRAARNGVVSRLEHSDGSTLEVRLLRRQSDAYLDVIVLRERAPSRRTLAGTLTKRELEVLELLATGLSDTEIATSLGVSRHTIRRHVEHVFMKLGVHNRTEAAARLFAES